MKAREKRDVEKQRRAVMRTPYSRDALCCRDTGVTVRLPGRGW